LWKTNFQGSENVTEFSASLQRAGPAALTIDTLIQLFNGSRLSDLLERERSSDGDAEGS
jgi:hypothetical protein